MTQNEPLKQPFLEECTRVSWISLRVVVQRQPAAGSVAAVEAIFQIQPSFTNDIVSSNQIMVQDFDQELGLQRKRDGELKNPGTDKATEINQD